MVLREFVRRFREARGLDQALDAAMEEAFRGAVCDRLTARMFADRCPKMRRELLGRVLRVHRGTRSRWLDAPPSYENLLLGLLRRRKLPQADDADDGVIEEGTGAAMAVARNRIDGGIFKPPTVDAVRRLERIMRRASASSEANGRPAEKQIPPVALSAAIDDEDRQVLRDWFIPWLIFQDATKFLWRVEHEP